MKVLSTLRNVSLAALIGLAPSIAFALPPGSFPIMDVAQISCANTPTLINANEPNRAFESLVNTTTTPVYYGPSSTITTSTGSLLPGVVGASVNFAYTGGMYCIVATGTAVITKTTVHQ
jgi:hypothetical protein